MKKREIPKSIERQLQDCKLFGNTEQLPEAEPFKFERDKPIENANEIFEAWAKLRRQIDIEKREGAI